MKQKLFFDKTFEKLIEDSRKHDKEYERVSKDIALKHQKMEEKASKFDLIRNKLL